MAFSTSDLMRESIRKLFIHFETALPNRRTQRRVNLTRLRAEAFHRAHAFERDSGDDPAPSGMDRPDDFDMRIHQQNRHAIRARNRQQDARFGGDHSIGIRLFREILSRHDSHVVAMHLVASCNRRLADNFAQSPPVLIDMGALVTDPMREVQARVRPRTHASQAAEKSVCESRRIPCG